MEVVEEDRAYLLDSRPRNNQHENQTKDVSQSWGAPSFFHEHELETALQWPILLFHYQKFLKQDTENVQIFDLP